MQCWHFKLKDHVYLPFCLLHLFAIIVSNKVITILFVLLWDSSQFLAASQNRWRKRLPPHDDESYSPAESMLACKRLLSEWGRYQRAPRQLALHSDCDDTNTHDDDELTITIGPAVPLINRYNTFPPWTRVLLCPVLPSFLLVWCGERAKVLQERLQEW